MNDSRADIARQRLAEIRTEFTRQRQINELIDEPQKSQWRLNPIHVKVVVAVIGSLAVVMFAWSSMGRTTVIEPTQAPTATSGTIVVDVSGKVAQPGIVTLPAGSRVVDAIEAAGGTKADTSGLNLARVLVDGEQIVVGVTAPQTAGGSTAVSLNSATAQQLESLPGIGPVTAQAIISWRTANGGFKRIDDLLKVKGIGSKTLAELKPHVAL